MKLDAELRCKDADLSSSCEEVKRLRLISFISSPKLSLALLNKSSNHNGGLKSYSEDSDEVLVRKVEDDFL